MIDEPKTVHYQDERVTLHHGDCLDVLRELPDCSVDSVVTDPPYGLSFMGNAWDKPVPRVVESTACVGCGNDDPTEGYTVCSDCLADLDQSGDDHAIPTSDHGGRAMLGHISKNWHEKGTHSRGYADNDNVAFQAWCEQWAVECLRVLKPGGHMLAFGGTRTWHRLAVATESAGFEIRDSIAWMYGSGFPKSLNVSKAIDKAAGIERFQGWGTALKPAFEPIVVARKPIEGTVASNVLTHGTGALNIDACRIEGDAVPTFERFAGNRSRDEYRTGTGARTGDSSPAGRWPANVVLDEAAAAELDAQTGQLASGANPTRRGSDKFRNAYGEFAGQEECTPARGADSGGASRFFYTAKASQVERVRVDGTAHPTVKPLNLMRWLVRLVTPPGGVVLEPFAGSGTTVEAALREGFRCVAIEREASYLPLIQHRIDRERNTASAIATLSAAAESAGDPDLFAFDTEALA